MPAALAGIGVALRPETEADLPFLSRLYVSIRWDELAPLTAWSDDQKLAFLADQFRLQRLHYATYYAGADFMIIEDKGEPIGRLYLDRVARTDLRIVDIAFLPAYRGRGYGSLFLGAVLEEAAADGKVASIHVEEMNPAKRLYERLGFRQVSPHGPYWLMEKAPAQLKTA